MRFSPYKDSLCPKVSPSDGLHSLLLRKSKEEGGERRKERRRKRMSERGERKRSGAVQQ